MSMIFIFMLMKICIALYFSKVHAKSLKWSCISQLHLINVKNHSFNIKEHLRVIFFLETRSRVANTKPLQRKDKTCPLKGKAEPLTHATPSCMKNIKFEGNLNSWFWPYILLILQIMHCHIYNHNHIRDGCHIMYEKCGGRTHSTKYCI